MIRLARIAYWTVEKVSDAVERLDAGIARLMWKLHHYIHGNRQ